jgi:hypothetical protein
MNGFLRIILLTALLGGWCLPARAAEPEKSEPAKKAEDAKGTKDRDPFAPSRLMREQARRASSSAAGGAAGLAFEGAPVMEGLIVKDKSVLACFRIGKFSALVEPGGSFQAGEVKYTFAKYESETVTLQDQDGNVYEMKPGAGEKPRPAEAQGGGQP